MKENEIRNRGVLNRYLELLKKDTKTFFKPADFVKVKCPACAGSSFTFEFKKNSFSYVSCRKCGTLFTTPRPSARMLNRFYVSSSSTRFWIDEFFGPVAESRRDKIFRPRAEYVSKTFPECINGLVGDIGAGFGIFLEELRRLWPHARFVAIEPSPEQADMCRRKGLEVRCSALEEVTGLEGQFDLLISFEVLEHLFDPCAFLGYVYLLLKPGGGILLTTLNGKGFDIQLLWERSRSFCPPAHLNFFNPESMVFLFERCGFEVADISTPGKLDWDIVEGMIKEEGVSVDRFWNHLADSNNVECKKDLQDWISKNNLSSHMRILAKRPK